ncbi:MAG: DHH family phosphoesterase [Thermoplasmata archaeon]
MIKDILPSAMFEKLQMAKESILENKYIKIVVHFDGDGTSSAVILCNMMKRIGKEFHLTYIKDLSMNGFMEAINDGIFTIIADAGSDQLKYASERSNIIVLDHHFYEKTATAGLNINARDFGFNGTTEACGATMSYAMALVMDENNKDLFPFFIAGLISDKQDLGGISGLNKILVDSYGKDFRSVHTLNLEGQTLVDALTYSTDPFFKNITGFPDKASNFLKDTGLDPEEKITELNEDEKRLLMNSLAIKLLEQGVGIEALRYLESDIYIFDEINFTSKELASIIDGNGKMGSNSVPVVYFLGHREYEAEMTNNWKMFKTKLIDYTYRSLKEIFETENVSYFYAPESEMSGAISGILMLYLANQKKPIIGFNVGGDNTKVSGRGTRKQVQNGLNLSIVMKEASTRVGGTGGGHDIAAGAVIPKGREMQFLEAADEIIAAQLSVRKVS